MSGDVPPAQVAELDGSSKSSPGRAVKGKPAAGGYGSYAAISYIKDNHLLSNNNSKRALESKSSPERASTSEDGGGLASPRGSACRPEIGLRGGTSQQLAVLRAEVEMLKQQNADLQAKLHESESRNTRPDLDSSLTGLQQELASAQAGRTAASQAAAAAALQVAQLQAVLGSFTLQPEELEAAGLTCALLARYWELAACFGFYPEVASSYAEQWRAVAPPAEALMQSVRHQRHRRQAAPQQQRQGSPGPAAAAATAAPPQGAGSASSSSTPGPAAADLPSWLKPGSAGHFTLGCGATVADLLEVQQGLCQLQQLGLPQAVLAALGSTRRSTLLLPTAVLGGNNAAGAVPVQLTPEEAAEARWQAAWLAYQWGRAAEAGVEPLLAKERATHWAQSMEREPSPQLLQEVALGLQELAVLAVEQQVWQVRVWPGV